MRNPFTDLDYAEVEDEEEIHHGTWVHESKGTKYRHDPFKFYVRLVTTCEKKDFSKHHVFHLSYRANPASIEDRFKELAEKWKSSTSGYSTTIHKIADPNYQEIIKMGTAIVPYILKDLENSSVWFTALRELTKENPVAKNDAGNTKRMREVWLQWAKDKKLI